MQSSQGVPVLLYINDRYKYKDFLQNIEQKDLAIVARSFLRFFIQKICVSPINRGSIISTMEYYSAGVDGFLCQSTYSGKHHFYPCHSETSYPCGFAGSFLHFCFFLFYFSNDFTPFLVLFRGEKLIDTVLFLFLPDIIIIYFHFYLSRIFKKSLRKSFQTGRDNHATLPGK